MVDKMVDICRIGSIFTIQDFVKDSGIPFDSGQNIIAAVKNNSVISVRKEGSGQNPSVYKFSDLLAII